MIVNGLLFIYLVLLFKSVNKNIYRHSINNQQPIMNPTRPTDGPNQYGPLLVKPVPPALSGTQAAGAPVSALTGSDVIKANLIAAEVQNNVVSAGNGRVGGGSKRKRSHKRSHKRSSRHKRHRNKRGGNPTTGPTTRPTTTVPQFGPQHAGANLASINLNGGAMMMTKNAAFDSVDQPPTTTHFQ